MFLGEPAPTSYDLHFSILGMPVRISPWFWLVGLIFGYGSASGEGIKLVIWMGVFFVSILWHELGHAIFMRYYGGSPRIVLCESGGLAISGGRRTPMEDIWVTIAGPGAGLLLAFVVMGLAKGMGDHIEFVRPTLQKPLFWEVVGYGNDKVAYLVDRLLYCNIFWSVLNLLPILPLDGGQIMRQILLMGDPWDGVRKSLWVSVIVAAVFAICSYAIWDQPNMAIFFGIFAYSSYMGLSQMGGGGRRRW